MNKVATILSAALVCYAVGGPTWADGGAGTAPMSPASPFNATTPASVGPSGKTTIDGFVRTDQTSYMAGTPVSIAFALSNKGKDNANYSFSTAQQFDVAAVNSMGQEVWHWSHSRAFAQTLTHLTLKPGQAQTYRAVWTGTDDAGHPVPSGTYILTARMNADIRPAIRGGVVVDITTDPNNMGVPTKTRADTGALQEVTVNGNVTANTTVKIVSNN